MSQNDDIAALKKELLQSTKKSLSQFLKTKLLANDLHQFVILKIVTRGRNLAFFSSSSSSSSNSSNNRYRAAAEAKKLCDFVEKNTSFLGGLSEESLQKVLEGEGSE